MSNVEWSAYMEVPGTDRPILLSPLSWKNGNQVDNLATMVRFFQEHDTDKKTIVLIYKSQCGSGKSLSLLHVPKEMEGRAIFVTPFKNLQRQYYTDYFKGNKFVMKKDGTRLKVSVFLGRNNFQCRWLEEQYDYQQKIIEANKKFDQSMPIDDNILRSYQIDCTAANRYLPCTKMLRSIGAGRREPRYAVASACQYWIPPPMPKNIILKWSEMTDNTVEESYDINTDSGINEQQTKENMQTVDGASSQLDKIKAKINCSNIEYYESVGKEEMGVFIRDEKDKYGKPCADVCPYYKQFYSYVRSDVIVFNSAKWNLETMMGRKPKVKVEVIDEGDYWLDSQATTIELARSTIDKIFPGSNKMKQIKMDTLANFDMSFKKIKSSVSKSKETGENIINTKDYKQLFYAINVFLAEYKKQNEDDDTIDQKLLDIATVRQYADVASLSYVEGKRSDTKIIKVYIPYPDKLLQTLFSSSSKNIVLTSGTMHSNFVLSNLFGINTDNYVVDILIGRKEHPGKLTCIRPQKDGIFQMVKVTYTTWQSPEFREYYFSVLNYMLDQLKIGIDKKTGKPGDAKIIVLTPAKKYAEGILKRHDIFVDFAKNKNSQDEDDIKVAIDTNLSDYVDNTLVDIRKIKCSDIELDGDVLRTDKQIIVSTRMVRGTDLKDDKCRAIVMTKWPVGDISDGYLQAIKKRFGEKIFWEIVRDKAAREAVQYVSRGLRHDFDWTLFATPDSNAFDQVFRLFSYDP
jgi:Rad3-related DNA helicase